MSKVKIIDKKSIKSINSERELLSKLYHPFIVNMHYAFQDDKYLYLVMDLLTGGDLRYHISFYKKFSEEQTRFFICGIFLALEYIHLNNIIHRDVKPENLVLDENGYIRLTDFGIAKINLKDNSSETSGTPGYMSPEVINSTNHSFPSDFFALGVIGYEFMRGERPYVGKSRKEIKEQMISRQAEIKIEELKEDADNWSKESIDFINKLLKRKPEERLGYKKGVKELKEHPWLKYYPWELIKNKKLPAPFIPQNKDNFDKKYCKGEEYVGEETKIRYEEILLDDNYEFYFKNFYYNIDEDKNRKKNNDINLLILPNNKKENKKENKKNNIKKEIKKNNNSKEKANSINKLNNIYNLFNQIRKSNSHKNKKFIKINHNIYHNNNNKNRDKEKNIKFENSNLILINFNINNITNNNINKNKINNFYLNRNNIKTERIKKIGRKINISNLSKNNNYNNIGANVNDFSLNQISLHSPLNSSSKMPIKNYTNNTKSKSKSKSKNKKDNKNKYNYNNSLITKLTKINLSQVRLLKNKNKNMKNNFNNNNTNLNISKFIHKTNSQIYSISSNRENNNNSKFKDKNNSSLNAISLNDGLNLNISRKYNNNIIDKNIKFKNYSKPNYKSKKIIFDKKVFINNKIDVKNRKKNFKNSIPISKHNKCESYLKIEKIKTLQNKSEIIKKIIYTFKKDKKKYNDNNKKYRSKNNKIKKVFKKYNNISTYNEDKDNKLKRDYSERIKNEKTYFSDNE